MLRIFIYMVSGFWPFLLLAQDSIQIEKLAEVSVVRHTGIVNSLDLSEYANVTSTWQINNRLNVIQYGSNGLATIAFRGGNAEQLAVQWEGISLNSIANGVVDFNLIPIHLFSSITLNSSNSTSTGSGSITGTLNMVSDIKSYTEQHANLALGVGSFGNMHLHTKVMTHTRKGQHVTQVYAQKIDNNFSVLVNDLPVRMANNPIQQIGLMHGSTWKRKKGNIKFKYWSQYTNRIIPNGVNEVVFTQSQKDASNRILVEKEKWLFGGRLTSKLAFFNEELFFEDSKSKISNDYTGRNWVGLFHWVRTLSNDDIFSWDNEYRNQYYKGDTFYTQRRKEWSTSLRYSKYLDKYDIKTKAAIRLLRVNSELEQAPILYSFDIFKKLKIGSANATISKNYRFPTFNQLYWNPGGNAALTPEESLNTNFKINFQDRKNFGASLELYRIQIKNRIVWLPGSNYSQAVQIDGIQNSTGADFHMIYGLENIKMEWAGSWNQSRFGSDKKQAPFIPRWKQNASITWKKNSCSTVFSYAFQGKRFQDMDNSLELPSYHLMNLALQYEKNPKTLLTLRINNLLNKTIYIIPNQPLPRMNFELQWRQNLTFKKNKL